MAFAKMRFLGLKGSIPAMQMRLRPRWLAAWGLVAACGLLLACAPAPTGTPAAAPAEATRPGAATPAEAVTDLVGHLRQNELAEIARAALPPALHAEVEAAWRRGESRWPLTELPLDDSIPGMLAALTRPAAEEQLRVAYRRQLSGQTRAMQDAARGLGVFGKEYLGREGRYNAQQRQHYMQLVDRVASWAAQAPLGDPERGRQSIALLVKGAERSGVKGDDDFTRLGMEGSLKALVPLYIAFKQMLGLYGLGVDATLAGLEAETVSTEGDAAEVRVRYQLDGREIQTVIHASRVEGRWYLTDYLDAARESTLRPEADHTAVEPAATEPAAPDPAGG